VGQKLSSEVAKAAVDDLYSKVAKRWEQKVTHGEFMTSLATGQLPRGAIKALGSLRHRDQYDRGLHLSEAPVFFQKTP